MESKMTCFILCSVLFWFCNVSHAGILPLPDYAKSIIVQIEAQCDGCLEKGFSPSGNDKIGFGKNFFPNFFLGTPKAGILVSHVMTGKQYEALLRQGDLEEVKEALLQKFVGIKLVVIEWKDCNVHVSGKPKEVRVVLTKELHKCMYHSTNPLCCCCTTNCETECCEKKLGSTYVLIRWKDPLNADQSIEYAYYPHSGASRIVTVNESGKRENFRWCLDSAGRGFLK